MKVKAFVFLAVLFRNEDWMFIGGTLYHDVQHLQMVSFLKAKA
jgi:hypothetical protein